MRWVLLLIFSCIGSLARPISLTNLRKPRDYPDGTRNQVRGEQWKLSKNTRVEFSIINCLCDCAIFFISLKVGHNLSLDLELHWFTEAELDARKWRNVQHPLAGCPFCHILTLYLALMSLSLPFTGFIYFDFIKCSLLSIFCFMCWYVHGRQIRNAWTSTPGILPMEPSFICGMIDLLKMHVNNLARDCHPNDRPQNQQWTYNSGTNQIVSKVQSPSFHE